MNKSVVFILGLALGLVAGLFIGHSRAGSEPLDSPPPVTGTRQRPGPVRERSAGQRDVAMPAAVAALEALSSATKAGVTYQSYLDRKIDAHVVVDRYLNVSGEDAPLGLSLREALRAFDAAGTLWSACIRSEGCEHDFLDPSGPNSEIADIFQEFPGLMSFQAPSGKVEYKVALSYLWQRASETITGARQAL